MRSRSVNDCRNERANGTDSPPRPSGSTPVEPAQPPRGSSETLRNERASMPCVRRRVLTGKPPSPWGHDGPIPGGSMTCTETSRNGCWIGSSSTDAEGAVSTSSTCLSIQADRRPIRRAWTRGSDESGAAAPSAGGLIAPQGPRGAGVTMHSWEVTMSVFGFCANHPVRTGSVSSNPRAAPRAKREMGSRDSRSFGLIAIRLAVSFQVLR